MPERETTRSIGRQRLMVAIGFAVVALGITAAIAAWDVLSHREQNIEKAQALQIDGPPCPALTAAEFAAKGYRLRNGSDYNELRYAWTAGAVQCDMVAGDGGKDMSKAPICQFTSPFAMKITTGRGDFYFAPGVGKPATVTITDGQPKCVLAAKFSLN